MYSFLALAQVILDQVTGLTEGLSRPIWFCADTAETEPFNKSNVKGLCKTGIESLSSSLSRMFTIWVGIYGSNNPIRSRLLSHRSSG
ncbi:hypothetical protein DBV39_03880 [Orrella marina]|uniref:Uncharacterized protein n=1 Tax=Orrella marina TaxID=2163011 RepID=A0A2R4XGP3_9BURK|nr:hypothetical protein DBV39_03880 [Orrella marina]